MSIKLRRWPNEQSFAYLTRTLDAQRIQDEAELAAQIQQQEPGVTRSEALRVAYRILNKAQGRP